MALVKISFEMEEAVRDELMLAILSIRGYSSFVVVDGETVANPVTPAQFCLNEFVQHGQNLIAQKRYETAREAAAVAAKAALDTEILAPGIVTASVETL